METLDYLMWMSKDWDPNYLKEIFREDFDDYSELWKSNVGDTDLIKEVENVEKYCPVVGDISLDDKTLCAAVEKIEDE